MSDDPAPPPPKPGRKTGGMIVAVAAFVGGAAAGGGGAGMAIVALGLGGGGGSAGTGHAPEAAAHAVEYVEIDNAFTSNLVDTGRYLQLRVAVATTGGAPVTTALAAHKPAIVSAVLGVIGEAGEADVADRKAKDRLRAGVRTAINDVLKAKAKVGGIDDVFFTTLVVQ